MAEEISSYYRGEKESLSEYVEKYKVFAHVHGKDARGRARDSSAECAQGEINQDAESPLKKY